MFGPAPQYGLGAPAFRYPALAAQAARGRLGGDRELALAAFVAAHLAAGAIPPPESLPAPIRAARAAGARRWYAALALPASVRAVFVRVADATAGDEPALIAPAIGALIDAVARALDPGARAELDALVRQLA